MWIHNINTYRARNLLCNTMYSAMTPAQWSQVLAYTSSGITKTDLVFTGRTNPTGDFLSPNGGAGTLSWNSSGDPNAGANTYTISERLIQQFHPNDLRFLNNFDQQASGVWVGPNDRGNSYNTRWELVSGGLGVANTYLYANNAVGQYEMFMAGSWEENELMKAEALINTGSINAGATAINNVRSFQGAGTDPAVVLGTGLTLAQAMTELKMERRTALLFRRVSFYDARRYGVIFPLSQGGGLTGAWAIDFQGNFDSNATIDYQFMDYWDVPDNELAYNPPSASSASLVKNTGWTGPQ
jgi:hypothetical protein